MFDYKANTLLTLEQKGSYTKAAQSLMLTQPAVSHQIRQLEMEFGIQIFYKGKKGLKLTPEGSILVKYARRSAAIYNNARQAIEDSRNNLRRFTVAITPTASESLVPKMLAHYCDENPDVHIKILTDPIKKIYDKLKAYETDIAIVEGCVTDTSLSPILLDTDYVCLAVAPNHRLSGHATVGLEDIRRERFILRSRKANTRALFEQYLANRSESIKNLNIMMEIDNIATIKELVAQGLGITVIAHSACREEENNGRLSIIPIENAGMVREINIVTTRDFAHPDILEEFRKIYNML